MEDWDDEDVAALVVSLCEPLLPLDVITGIHARANRAFAQAPHMARLWAGGLLRDLIDALPAADPWRNPREGFGTWQDGADLIPPTHRNLFIDIGLAALATPLEPSSVALIRAATGGIDDVLASFAADVPEPDLFNTVLPALRWLTWRRRVYVGPEDPFVLLTGFEWIHRARLIADGQPWSRQAWMDAARSGRVDDDEYDLAAPTQTEPHAAPGTVDISPARTDAHPQPPGTGGPDTPH